MKKSKVIIPAMALLLFSTAASITGTVAWFTSSRVFTTDAGTFQVAQLDGNMDVELTGGVGTYVKGQKGQPGYEIGVGVMTDGTVDDTVTNYLLDSSFNHTNGHAYRLNREGAGYEDKLASDGGKWLYRTVTTTGQNAGTSNYYVALTWTMTFKYTFNQESADVGLFLNLNDTASKFTAGNQTGKTNAAKGFRIAFVGGGSTKVWGDLASETVVANQEVSSKNDGNYTYVASTSALGNYTADTVSCDFLSSAAKTNYSLADDEMAANATRIDRIGTFNFASAVNGVSTLTITCTAWYEGSDPNVVNDAAMKTVNAKMSFYARTDGTKS